MLPRTETTTSTTDNQIQAPLANSTAIETPHKERHDNDYKHKYFTGKKEHKDTKNLLEHTTEMMYTYKKERQVLQEEMAKVEKEMEDKNEEERKKNETRKN